MRAGGLEPPRPFGHSDLSAARLPVTPGARTRSMLGRSSRFLPVPESGSCRCSRAECVSRGARAGRLTAEHPAVAAHPPPTSTQRRRQPSPHRCRTKSGLRPVGRVDGPAAQPAPHVAADMISALDAQLVEQLRHARRLSGERSHLRTVITPASSHAAMMSPRYDGFRCCTTGCAQVRCKCRWPSLCVVHG